MLHRVIALGVLAPKLTLATLEPCHEASPANPGMQVDVDMQDRTSVSFTTIGDYGFTSIQPPEVEPVVSVEDLTEVTAQMADWIKENDASFVLSAGDNFYLYGVDSVYDERWETTFENVFADSAFDDMYFFQILGNHDWYGNGQLYENTTNQTMWDKATRTQIMYTSNRDANPRGRWCMPSYYYAVVLQLSGFSVRLLGIDTFSLVECAAGEKEENCKGATAPDAQDQLDWIENQLANAEEDWVIGFSHWFLASIGNHGLNSSVNIQCNADGHTAMITTLTNMFAEHRAHLWVSGHDHNTQMFEGVLKDEDADDGYTLWNVGTGMFGFHNGKVCGNQDDIQEQYNDLPDLDVDWQELYGDVTVGFAGMTLTMCTMSVEFVDLEGNSVVLPRSLAKPGCETPAPQPEQVIPESEDEKSADAAQAILGAFGGAVLIIGIVAAALVIQNRHRDSRGSKRLFADVDMPEHRQSLGTGVGADEDDDEEEEDDARI